MHENLEEKLNHLGITFWKRRDIEDTSLMAKKMYLIDNNFLFLVGGDDENLTEEEIENFFTTLALSLGQDKYYKITDFQEVSNISHVFLLDEGLSEESNILDNVLVHKLSSIKTVCASKESKINFLNYIKGFIC